MNLPALPPLPDFTLPAFFARIGSVLPQRPPALALTTLLNISMRLLGDALPRSALGDLAGKRFRLCLTDAGLRLDFCYQDTGTFSSRAASEDGVVPDLVISARCRDYLALLLREEDADTLFFNRRLLMEGDTELGLLVKNSLDTVDPWQIVRSRLPQGLQSLFVGR